MTAMTPARTPDRPVRFAWNAFADDARQLIAVVLLIAVALIAGYLVKTVAESQTRSVRAGDVSAAIPSDWLYQPGAGDLLFTATDPRHPGQRYTVSRVTPGSGGLRETIEQRIGAKSALLEGYQQLSREANTIGGKTGEAVTYAYVVGRDGQLPQVVQARDLYVNVGNQVLAISLEARAADFEAALGGFERFVSSVGG
jgi:hypothetical protein